MKRRVIGICMAAAMTAGVFAGCSSRTADISSGVDDGGTDREVEELIKKGKETRSSSADEVTAVSGTYALVPKSAGNPFNEREADGFRQAVEAVGGKAVIAYPKSADAEAQIAEIRSLIGQKVDTIAVAANDPAAISEVLQEAKAAGIRVCTLDADAAAEDRSVFCNQAGAKEIGRALMDAVYDIAGGEGEYAILSSTPEASNQNAWIKAMEEIAKSDSRYASLTLDEVVYGDDDAQKSADETQALLAKYQDLKVICAPTTVGMTSAAGVLSDQGSGVKLTGLGLPSGMRAYIGADDAHVCPYMFLWNPTDLGMLAGYTSVALASGQITGREGDRFACGLGDYTVTANSEGATEIILGSPYRFDSSNIEEWAKVY
jgi:rhamnose transport system substrate-binding protein